MDKDCVVFSSSSSCCFNTSDDVSIDVWVIISRNMRWLSFTTARIVLERLWRFSGVELLGEGVTVDVDVDLDDCCENCSERDDYGIRKWTNKNTISECKKERNSEIDSRRLLDKLSIDRYSFGLTVAYIKIYKFEVRGNLKLELGLY